MIQLQEAINFSLGATHFKGENALLIGSIASGQLSRYRRVYYVMISKPDLYYQDRAQRRFRPKLYIVDDQSWVRKNNSLYECRESESRIRMSAEVGACLNGLQSNAKCARRSFLLEELTILYSLTWKNVRNLCQVYWRCYGNILGEIKNFPFI